MLSGHAPSHPEQMGQDLTEYSGGEAPWRFTGTLQGLDSLAWLPFCHFRRDTEYSASKSFPHTHEWCIDKAPCLYLYRPQAFNMWIQALNPPGGSQLASTRLPLSNSTRTLTCFPIRCPIWYFESLGTRLGLWLAYRSLLRWFTWRRIGQDFQHFPGVGVFVIGVG